MKTLVAPDHGFFAALDIGTSKVAALIGRKSEEGGVELLGYGVVPSGGVRSGAVNNVQDAADAIRMCMHEAEKSSGVRIRSAVVGIAGRDVESREVSFSHGFGERGREILPADVIKLQERARGSVAEDEIALHVEPQQYIIDGRITTSDPVGMWGIKLDFLALVITASLAAVNNLARCVRIAGAEVDQYVLEPVASAEAVLDSDERLLGTAILDMGGGTSDLAIFQRGALRATLPIQMGGEAVTLDLAKVLGAPVKVAEQLKLSIGLSGDESPGAVEVLRIGGGATREVPSSLVSEVIRARLEEILETAALALEAKKFREPLAGGIVLTGGTARLAGLADLASRYFKVRVRCGETRDVKGDPSIVSAPEHATGVGLLLRAASSQGDMPAPRAGLRLWQWLKDRWHDLG